MNLLTGGSNVAETSETVECETCGLEFPLVPRQFAVPSLTGNPTTPLRFKRSNPSLVVAGVRVEYCSKKCFKERDEVQDCWACGLANPSEFHVGRTNEVPEGLRCPGCCGPVYRNNFCSQEEKDRFTAYTCGTSTFKIGTHGSLAYLRPGDTRDLQAALDEEFVKKQVDREDWKQRFLAGEKLTRHSCNGGGEIAITHCPRGQQEATAHDVDCKCMEEQS